MIHTEVKASQENMYRVLASEQRTTVSLAIEMLLRCHLSPKQILIKAADALEGSQLDS